MNSLITRLSICVLLSAAPAAFAAKADAPRPLTGVECALTERLIGRYAEIMGVDKDGLGFRHSEQHAQAHAEPEAAMAAHTFVVSFNRESKLRGQYEMRMAYAKKCKEGSIRLFPRSQW